MDLVGSPNFESKQQAERLETKDLPKPFEATAVNTVTVAAIWLLYSGLPCFVYAACRAALNSYVVPASGTFYHLHDKRCKPNELQQTNLRERTI
eukprot:2864855-Amphidinium_carterae.2